MTITSTLLARAGAIAAAGLLASTVAAQSAPTTTPAPKPPEATPFRSSGSPERDTLLRMQRRVSVKVDDVRLEDVIRFIQDVTQADIEPLWTTDNVQGLDKDKKITLDIKNQPALYALETILDKAKSNDYSENTWQLTPSGAMQIGPKDLLNKFKRLVVYDINDLLLVIPRFPDVPQIDLNSVLQQSQGGSGQSPFQNDQTQGIGFGDGKSREDRAKGIMDLITSLVDPPQWVDNGGEGASIRYFNGTLLINAPDYIHRQINGYPFWPSTTVRTASSGKQRRYVTLNMDVGAAKVEHITNYPITATAGGGTTGGGTGGGPGSGSGGP